MSSLAKCIELSNIPPAEAKNLMASADAYRKEGYAPQDSNTNAVKDAIKELEAERADIVRQIRLVYPVKPEVKAKEPAKKAQKEVVPKEPKKEIPEKIEVTPTKEGEKVSVDLTKKEVVPKKEDKKGVKGKRKKQFSAKAVKPQEVITRKDLKDIFSSMQNVTTGQDSKGNFWFKPEGRPRVIIHEVDHIKGFINTSAGKIAIGSYLKNEIELKTKGAGFTADEQTVFHEFEHYLENAGILTSNDIKALNSAIGGENVTSEQRADFVGAKLAGWRSEKNLRIKRILKKIADFMNAIYGFVSKTRTARGVTADIESGRILKQKAKEITDLKAVPAYQQTADRFYSQVIKTVQDKMPAKMQTSAVLPWLRKQPGVKIAELEWMNIEELLEGKKIVTKDEFVNLLEENQVVVEEIEKGKPMSPKLGEYNAIREYAKKEENLYFDDRGVDGYSYLIDEETNETVAAGFADEMAASLNLTVDEVETDTEFAEQQLPGEKENYRELLLKLPAKHPTLKADYKKRLAEIWKQEEQGLITYNVRVELTKRAELEFLDEKGEFVSPHWKETNVFAHARVNERVDADGNKILFIEEIQSDWAAKGRSEGYRVKAVKRRLSIKQNKEGNWILEDQNRLISEHANEKDAEKAKQKYANKLTTEGAPDMPFKKNWHEVALKRIVRMAAEQGIDKIAWITGQQTADRYDLSKHLSEVHYSGSNLVGYDHQGAVAIKQTGIMPEDLHRYIGKELSQRLMDKKSEKGLQSLVGLDLRVGGAWAFNLYDRTIPQYLKKFGKKYEAEIGTTSIPKSEGTYIVYHRPTGDSIGEGYSLSEAKKAIKGHPDRGYVEWPSGTTEQPSFTITPELKRAAMFEGMPLFQTKGGYKDTLGPTTEADYTENRKHNRDIKAKTISKVKNVKAEIAEGIDKFLGSISSRLERINPKIKAKLRKLDFDITTQHAKDVKGVEALLRKAKKMTRDDMADWDYARKNSDEAKINYLVDKYKMQEEYKAYRKVLNKVREEAIDVGLDIGEIDEYAPRILKDHRGFLTAIGKSPDWDVYSRKLKEKAQELETTVEEMDLDMRANIISNMILSGQMGLGGVPATKERKLEKIPSYLNQYYMDSDSALMQHLYGMRKLIEGRKFFGKIPEKVKTMRTRMYAAQKQIRDLNKQLSEKPTEEQTTEIKKKRNKYIGLEKQYRAYLEKYAAQRDYRENIGAYIDDLIIKKEIDPGHQRVLNDILNARFHEIGTRGLIQAYKNIAYIDTMGSPISAITQIGDLAWAMYEGGLIRGLKHTIRAIGKKSTITKEDVGIDRIAQEFADPGTFGKTVAKIFKWVGLEKIDAIGKEALLNTALEKYQKLAKTTPKKLQKQIQVIFESETDSVIDDLVNNEMSDNVKLLVYSRLLDFQPVALSEMPQKYLDAGNGRVFYMLKTFTLKVFDVFRNESYNKIRYGDKAEKIQGMKNLVTLSMFFVLANAGADELKDFVLGRKTDLEDRVVDNVLRLFGVSKYITWRARTEGLPSAMARQILPPFKFFDAAYKDIMAAGDDKGIEMVSSVPVGGKLFYWHMGRGVSKRESLWDRRLRKYKSKLNDIDDKLKKSKDKTAFKRKYKKELRELRTVNRFQARINKIRQGVNRIKSLEETKTRKKQIQRLEVARTELIKRFLASK